MTNVNLTVVILAVVALVGFILYMGMNGNGGGGDTSEYNRILDIPTTPSVTETSADDGANENILVKLGRKNPHTLGRASGRGNAGPALSGEAGTLYEDSKGFKTWTSAPYEHGQKVFAGQPGSRHEHLGAYVRSKHYTSACMGPHSSWSNEGASEAYQAKPSEGFTFVNHSRCRKQPRPNDPTCYGLSTSDLMFPAPGDASCPSNVPDYGVNKFDSQACSATTINCDPCKMQTDCMPFDDVIRDAPRDLCLVDTQLGNESFITTTKGQSTDLRGDIAICCDGDMSKPIVHGANSTRGCFVRTKAFRPYIY